MLLPWVLFFSFFPNKTSSLSPSSTGTLQSALTTALAARRDLLATLHDTPHTCDEQDEVGLANEVEIAIGIARVGLSARPVPWRRRPE